MFRDHGDDRRYLYCGIGEALLFDRTERYREAYDTLIPLLEVARGSGDVESEARIQSNLAHAAVYLGELQAANVHLSEAIARFVDLGKRVEAIRTELAGGRVLLARGQQRLGIQRLYDARRSFLMHGMVEEAGLCGLEIVEALLQNGSPRPRRDWRSRSSPSSEASRSTTERCRRWCTSAMQRERTGHRSRPPATFVTTSIRSAKIRPASSSRCGPLRLRLRHTVSADDRDEPVRSSSHSIVSRPVGRLASVSRYGFGSESPSPVTIVMKRSAASRSAAADLRGREIEPPGLRGRRAQKNGDNDNGRKTTHNPYLYRLSRRSVLGGAPLVRQE